MGHTGANGKFPIDREGGGGEGEGGGGEGGGGE